MKTQGRANWITWMSCLAGISAIVLALGAGQAEPRKAMGGGGGSPFGPIGDEVVKALHETEGCLGVEFASTASGKQAIFAWFEDKPAVLRFYSSAPHRAAMNRFFPDRPPHEPLSGVADDAGPILAIASITPAAKPNPELGGIPIAQISIELLTPLPGGLDFGGTFAPKGAQARPKEKAAR